jgi:heme A synthase
MEDDMLKRLAVSVISLTLLALLATWAVTAWTTPTPGITEENFRYLRWGMSRPAVERLLGGPGDDRDSGHFCWEGPACEICVRFDTQDMRVDEASLYLNGPNEISASLPEPTTAVAIRRMIGW